MDRASRSTPSRPWPRRRGHGRAAVPSRRLDALMPVAGHKRYCGNLSESGCWSFGEPARGYARPPMRTLLPTHLWFQVPASAQYRIDEETSAGDEQCALTIKGYFTYLLQLSSCLLCSLLPIPIPALL